LAEPLSRLLEKTTENLLLGLLRQLLLAMLMGVPPLVRVMGLLLWTMMSPMVMARGARAGILRFLLPVMEPPPMVSLMGILPLVLPFLRLVMELPAMLKVMGILCLLPLVVLLLCHRR